MLNVVQETKRLAFYLMDNYSNVCPLFIWFSRIFESKSSQTFMLLGLSSSKLRFPIYIPLLLKVVLMPFKGS
uniref:Uncharacterized protein n=1 Tax=Petalonia fascia TaxID=2893 RepID=A0A089MX95_PETFA|nr:hypothetical protein PefaMp27 [Petalonia fascia]AIQ78509.1 hypothetical protein PefaMp27 [Petalonia fascia]